MLMSETDTPKIGVLQSFSPLENKLNWLLIAVPITIYFSLIARDTGMSFIFSMIAIMPLAPVSYTHLTLPTILLV